MTAETATVFAAGNWAEDVVFDTATVGATEFTDAVGPTDGSVLSAAVGEIVPSWPVLNEAGFAGPVATTAAAGLACVAPSTLGVEPSVLWCLVGAAVTGDGAAGTTVGVAVTALVATMLDSLVTSGSKPPEATGVSAVVVAMEMEPAPVPAVVSVWPVVVGLVVAGSVVAAVPVVV